MSALNVNIKAGVSRHAHGVHAASFEFDRNDASPVCSVEEGLSFDAFAGSEADVDVSVDEYERYVGLYNLDEHYISPGAFGDSSPASSTTSLPTVSTSRSPSPTCASPAERRLPSAGRPAQDRGRQTQPGDPCSAVRGKKPCVRCSVRKVAAAVNRNVFYYDCRGVIATRSI